MTTPVIVGRLYDGKQLVRTVPFPMQSAPPTVDVSEGLIPTRLQELDAQFRVEGSKDEPIRVSRWKHVGWENSDLLPVTDWIHEYGRRPPESAIVRGTLVAVRYAEYKRM